MADNRRETMKTDKPTTSEVTTRPRRIPIEDFFRNPQAGVYRISPDGSRLAFLRPYENRMNIFVRELGSDHEHRLTSQTERDISNLFWKGNDRIIYTRDFGGDENFHVFSVGLESDEGRDLTPFPGVRASIIDDLEEQSETDILIGLNNRDPRIFDVHRLNTVTGDFELVAENPGTFDHWITDHDGKVRVATATDGVETTLLYREGESDPFRPIARLDFRESLIPAVFTPDNRNLYAISNLNRDRAALVIFDIASGSEVEVLYEHPEVDINGLSYSTLKKRIRMALFTTWKVGYHVFDPEWQAVIERLETLLPEAEITVSDIDRAENRIIVRTYSDRSLGAYYLYDRETDRIEKLGDSSPWLNPDELSAMEPIAYQSRDGLLIHGYLTLPVGNDHRDLPIVVHPHGGPWARDTWGFAPAVQFLANRGYGVLQMNFRGSTGYGKSFMQASFKEWGLKMQDDITDGVQWLIDQGIADPKRIAIFGASYGGYATLAGLAFTPEVYACGIDYVGVSNLFTFMETIPPYWESFREIMYEMVGHPEKDAELLRSRSPVFHVDRIQAPLMVIQGVNDPRVNVNESEQIVAALRSQGVDVEYLANDDEGHGFHNEENRIEVYRAIERFLEKHL